jgi:MFS family permease
MTAMPPATGFDIGRVISRLFGVVQRNFAAFLLLSVLLVGLPTAAASFLRLMLIAPAFSNATVSNDLALSFAPLLFLASSLIAVVANAVLQGAVIYATVSDLSGRKVSFGEALSSGLHFFLPLIGVGLIAGVCCFFGFLIFIVPGVLLALAWSVATPAMVIERTGVFGAFSRSAELTRNHRGAIFALAILAIIFGAIIQALVGGVMLAGGFTMVSGNPNPAGGALFSFAILQSIATLVAQTVSAMIGSAGVASVYYELRYVKEGVGAEQLAAVFD